VCWIAAGSDFRSTVSPFSSSASRRIRQNGEESWSWDDCDIGFSGEDCPEAKGISAFFGPKKACHGLQRLFPKKALPNHYKFVMIAGVASDNDLSRKFL
jgi:hypothetical protein